ncbi:NAD(P)H-dependent oxidoreductase [Streptomyces roseirectus]|uniref:NAD(P)H-dependent oxidoreductase n=1 Tax=Streptomyces roseirectus TaxID=2768066 RepID=A0A7H0IR29_9ACTN|nr:NAD(P)H-dependent oxidoreductase [Streptomyces roseirectus]QNP75245.1 NAD(P)H-dependent oxidoreductase [Streptomyces roseirectus]
MTEPATADPAPPASDTGPIRLTVIIASVREGRLGPVVATWFTERATAHDDVVVRVVDLRAYPLPLVMPEPGHAPPPDAARVRRLLAGQLAEADAFVVVTPEYNHTVPAALKNAIDWFHEEWAAKPVGFVSYGGLSGGLRAVEHLRQIFAELHTVSVRDSVSFHNAWDRFDERGRPLNPQDCEGAAKVLLDQLTWWGRVLRRARSERPYGT